jgi:hypothetical protein
MTYAQFNKIEASDYNVMTAGFANGAPNTSAAAINTVWSTGAQNRGYGQPSNSTVEPEQKITAIQWQALSNNITSAALHQGSSITTMPVIAQDGKITYSAAIPANLTTIYNNRLNAVAQGSTSSNTVTTTTTWSDKLTVTHTMSFANGDAARYFFNSGGQLAMTMTHPTGIGINLLLNNLASNVGTVVLSAPTSGTINIAGVAYNGVTKIGGGGNAPIIANSSGYYALSTSNANVFYQTASTGPSAYLSTNINILVKTNGAIGSNGDVGNVITVYTVWDEIPNNLVVNAGSTVTLTVKPPSTSYVANTWGAITLSGTSTSV